MYQYPPTNLMANALDDLLISLGIGVDSVTFLIIAAIVILLGLIIFLKFKRGRGKGTPQHEGANTSDMKRVDAEMARMLDELETLRKEKTTFKEKIDGLIAELNAKKEDDAAKEEKLKEELKNAGEELLKVSAMKDEIELLRTKVGELDRDRSEIIRQAGEEKEAVIKGLKEEIEREKEKQEQLLKQCEDENKKTQDLAAAQNAETVRKYEDMLKEERDDKQRLKNEMEEEKQKLIKDASSKEKETTQKYEGMLKEERESKQRLKNEMEEEKQRLIEDAGSKEKEITQRLTKEISDLKNDYETRIDEIKNKTKESIQQLIDEKDRLANDMKNENEELKKENDRLNEKIRMLEVDRL